MWRWVVVFVWLSGPAAAELQSLFPKSGETTTAATAPASLFAGARTGLFAPLPERRSAQHASFRAPQPTGTTPVDQLLSLMAKAEAGPAGYDAVQYGARIRPGRPPTQMTLGEIYAWIEAMPGQPHAIGRYQFIPPTLRRVARVRGFGPETPFTPGVQDTLALVLLEDAGLSDFQQGTLDRRAFMHNLAKIWAGLPLPNGSSYYEGHAGNSATMSWVAFDGGLQAIWGS